MSDLASNPFAELEAVADTAREDVEESKPAQSVDLTHDPAPREVSSALEAVAETAREHVGAICQAFVDGIDPAQPIRTRMMAGSKLLDAEAQVARIRLGAHAVANDQARLEAMTKAELVREITDGLAQAQNAGISVPENLKLRLAKAELTAALAGDVVEAEAVE